MQLDKNGREKPPQVGDLITVRGVRCKIVKVRVFGTIDVVSLDGQYAFRVTGLRF